MLYLTGNSTNVIYTNVSSNKTLSNPTYLMSLTHSQTGKRWSFIPQNISSYSGNPYNSRYDIFKFDISNTPVDLTGGTRAWYWENPPYIINDNDTRYLGSNKVYFRYNSVNDIFSLFQFHVDWNSDDRLTTGSDQPTSKLYINDVLWTGGSNTQNSTVDGQLQLVQFPIGVTSPSFQQEYKVSYEFTGTGGTIWSGTYYIPNQLEVYTTKPWQYYGYNVLNDAINVTLPKTHINTPSINIDEIGEFTYSIREQVNPVNINPSLAMNQLEVGLGYITELFSDQYYDSDEDSEVYDPDLDYPSLPNINGLYAWYDLQDTSTITLTGGTDITQVLDKSGNDYTLTPLVNPPSYSASTYTNSDGYYAMWDKRLNTSLGHNTPTKNWSGGTSFVVYTKPTPAGVKNIAGIVSGATGNTINQSPLGNGIIGEDIITWSTIACREGEAQSLYVPNDFAIVITRVNSNTLGDFDGAEYTKYGVLNADPNDCFTKPSDVGNWIVLGDNYYNDGVEVLNGIMEVIYYDRALTDSEYDSVLNYLKRKYNYMNWI